jgi:hypothetical protein
MGFPHMGHGTMFCNNGSSLLGAFLLVLATLDGTRRFGTAFKIHSIKRGNEGIWKTGNAMADIFIDL